MRPTSKSSVPPCLRGELPILALVLALIACGDDAPADPTAAQGPGGATTTQGGGGATTTHGGGGQGAGGNTPTCTDDPTLCTDQGLVCHEGSCVECAPDADDNCTGETPWCNPSSLACEPCTFHEHCPDSACNVFTGACLNAVPLTVGTGETDLATAISEAPAGDSVLLVEPRPNDGAYSLNNVSIGGKTIALRGQGGRPWLQGTNNFPTFTVANGATLLLEGIDLRGNNNSHALQANGQVALDRVEITQNSTGGIQATSTGHLIVRNSIIAGNGASAMAIQLGDGTLDLYFSAVGGVFSSSAAVSCIPGHTLTVRNSILFNRNANPTVSGCTSATITHTSADETLSGTGNDELGDPEQTPTLFTNLDNGNLRLTAAGLTTFDGVALWQPGDPPTDIDGQPRPTTEGPDVAGAHRGP